MHKCTKVAIVVLAILCASVCLLPLPTKVERTYQADDTYSNNPATISIDMTYYNFLFLNDKMSGTIQVEDSDKVYTYKPDSLFYTGMWPSNNQDGFFYVFNGFYLILTLITTIQTVSVKYSRSAQNL